MRNLGWPFKFMFFYDNLQRGYPEIGMIDRYCTPKMSAIWSRQAKYERWMQVEIAICEGYADFGLIPAPDVEKIKRLAAFDLVRCDEIEIETRHDLMAFVRNLSEMVGAPESRWIHFGVTSYDVIDTALGMMMRDSCTGLLDSLEGLMVPLQSLAETHRATPCIGRTHGVHAEPITFGWKVRGWIEEMKRNRARLAAAREEIAFGKISGPVGIRAHVTKELEAAICSKLGLQADPISTQIISRDRHASVLSVLAVLAGGLERVATELRNLQRTEVLEVQEAFASGQTGSSAMPHKRNPWNSETVCGLARVVRCNAQAMLESICTWHERDLSNSSLERIVLPDTFQLVDFMLNRLKSILGGLGVFPDRMRANLELMGDLVFSEHVMVALILKGMSREEAYKVAQRNAARAWDGISFRDSVAADPDVVSRLSAKEIDTVFSLEHHLQNALSE